MMKSLRGIVACCGIGDSIEKIEQYIDNAGKSGMNAVFTSLQIPEANKKTMLKDFPLMTAAAHRNGMKVCADYGEDSTRLFGFTLEDLKSIRSLGIDILRLDGSYTNEQAAELTFNKDGMDIQLNAADPFLLEDLDSLEINPERTYFCHNYYPMRYTGETWKKVKKHNDIIRSHGFRVAAFVPSQTNHRAPLHLGLPTLERHRQMDPKTAAQELIMLGCEDIFFGDDFPSCAEMLSIASLDSNVVDFRIGSFVSQELEKWLCDRTFRQRQVDLDAFIRGHIGPEETYKADLTYATSPMRKAGDIFIARPSMGRYTGELQIARTDLPADENFATVARVADCDLPLLETYRDRRNFRLLKA